MERTNQAEHGTKLLQPPIRVITTTDPSTAARKHTTSPPWDKRSNPRDTRILSLFQAICIIATNVSKLSYLQWLVTRTDGLVHYQTAHSGVDGYASSCAVWPENNMTTYIITANSGSRHLKRPSQSPTRPSRSLLRLRYSHDDRSRINHTGLNCTIVQHCRNQTVPAKTT